MSIARSEDIQKATRFALRYLTSRDRTEKELEAYLLRKGFSLQTAAGTMERLRRWGYLDDARVALAAARARMEGQHWGPFRLTRWLRGRGVDDRVVESVLQAVMEENDEESLARTAAERYLKTHPASRGAAGLRRMAGFLSRKGYSAEIIHRVLNRYAADPSQFEQ